jgi:hypothetical protein
LESNEQFLRKIALGDREALFSRADDGFQLASSDHDLRLALDANQAAGLFNLQRPELQLALRGIAADDTPAAGSIEAGLRDLRAQLCDEELLVLLDSTTLANALGCVYGVTAPRPLGLIDLAVVTFAAICYDRIVLQPSAGVSYFMTDELASVSSTLTYPDRRQFIRETLWSLCVDVSSQGGHRSGQEVMTQAWNDLLYDGEPQVHLDLHAHDTHQDSPMYWDGIIASSYINDLWDPQLYVDPQHARGRDTFLSIQTVRTLFNDALAGALGIPYMASALRGPIHWLLVYEKAKAQLLIDQLLARVGPPTMNDDSAATASDPYLAELSLPFLLGLVLEKMKGPADYWPVVLDYRERFAPLRRRIALDRNEWSGRSAKYMERFLSELRGGSPRYEHAVRGVAGVGADVGTALTGLPVGAGIKLVVTALAEPARRAWLKRRRPDVYLLMSLCDEARALRMAEENVRQIWGRSWDRAGREQLERLARGHPAQLTRLRNLELSPTDRS